MTMDERSGRGATAPLAGGTSVPDEASVPSPSLGIGANALARALARRALAARVEGRGTLALVVVPPDAPPIDVATRRWMVQAARDCGFTHVALEVLPAVADPDAALPGHHPA